jgi:diaminohydroxyphosphoribosylaminopyrimidine deaminase/5-amino-6-(5-phosphoribosylamino)uracil reductase
VIYASGDPNPRVDGSGAARLRAAGIEVATGLMGAEGEELNLGFFSRMRRGRPWLRLKLAASLDGRTALAHGESRWITGEAARADVHAWRAESAAILSTSATVLADDPELTARPTGGGSSAGLPSRPPLRVLLDARRRIPEGARVLAASGEVVRLVAPQVTAAAADAGPTAGRMVPIATDGTGRLSLPAALAWMGSEQLNEVWVEAGPTLAGSLLQAGLVDELVVYLAPRLLGPDARPLAQLPSPTGLAEIAAWQVQDLRQIGPDVRIMLRPAG